MDTETIALGDTLEIARRMEGCNKRDLCVLGMDADPYALDTPANHRDGQWLRDALDEVTQPGEIVHARGLHYRLMTKGLVKPNGQVYANTDDDWHWLAENALKAARWLGYVSFDRFDDRKHTALHFAPTDETFDPYGALETGIEVTLPAPGDAVIRYNVEGWVVRQHYRIVLVSEKTSCEPVMLRFQKSHGAEIICLTGEISDTVAYGIAQRAAEDGRPLVVGYLSDFDPTGFDMPVNLGRKLQAFETLGLRTNARVIKIGLTEEHVRDLGLPSSPLKPKDPRREAWLSRWGGLEQTEIDALAALQPDLLADMIEEALSPYFDPTLHDRNVEAVLDHEAMVNQTIIAALGEDVVERMQAEQAEKLKSVQAEIDKLKSALAIDPEALGIDIPDFVGVDPEPSFHEDGVQPDLILDPDLTWVQQTIAMRAMKTRA